MKINKSDKKFEACPPFEGRGVCVDVTELKRRETKFGVKEQFKIVYEVDMKRADGTPFCVWSKWMTPTSHEKSLLTAHLADWNGRPMTAADWEKFDTEQLLGRPCRLIVVNEVEEDGTFANIKLILPHRDSDGPPLKPSGTFVRSKDRDAKGGTYQSTSTGQNDAAVPADWSSVRVHVGKFKGHELADLDETAVQGLITHWLPTAKANDKATADDRRLIVALEKFQQLKASAAKQEDDVPY